jgi:hypothetical protein
MRADWYQQKITHPLLLPAYNGFLSKVPHDTWDTTPVDTNVVESAHAGLYSGVTKGVDILTAILQEVATHCLH